ncbi:FtsX-like permease family protein [Roseivirga sp.]|uniref:ABC transporter permease n=1 Tax=Roseivirga sp. TaxID=1964215 RepID=UPI003B8ACB2A
MLINYIKTTFRFFWKNKSYSLLNILGLSVGMACFIMLTLFVKNEFSYDEYHADKDRMFQVLLKDTASTRNSFAVQTMAPTGPLFKEMVPQVEETIRFGRMNNKVVKTKAGDKFPVDKIYYADETVFDFFSIDLLSGSSTNILASTENIAISKSAAIRLFGSVENAISKELEVVDFGKLVVSGVFQDIQDNTHLGFDYLMAFANADKAMGNAFGKGNSVLGKEFRSVLDWGVVSAFPLYIKLKEGNFDPEEIALKFQEALRPHRSSDIVKLFPVEDIYFSEFNNAYFDRKGEESNAQLYLIIAFIILGVAIINYMNMATARHAKRAKEVGIRKTVGGYRGQIMLQFFLESFLMAGISLLVAVCIAEVALPSLNSFIGKELFIAYDSVDTYLILIAFILSIGLLSGVYPSLYLSKFNPVQVLSGSVSKGRKGASFRKVLVGFQFFVCLGLIGVTTIVYSQFNYMQNIDLGFDKDQIVGVPIRDQNLKDNYSIFKDQILKNASITAASGVSYSVFKGNMNLFVDIEGFEESQTINYMTVETGFLETMGIGMEVGEPFYKLDESAAKKAMFVNTAAAEKFGWNDPLNEKLFGAPITGIVNDFVFGSAKKMIEPAVMLTSTKGFSQVYIKLNGADVKNSLKHIQGVFESYSKDYPFEFQFLDDHFAEKYAQEKKLSDVFSTFSLLAIFVAGLGIFGLSIFIAEQRIKEIGIRKILGASIGHIIWILNNSITKLMALVALITLPLVYYIMNDWLSEFAYHIALNGIILFVPLVALMLVVWGILVFQSYKSARVNPVNSLRVDQ